MHHFEGHGIDTPDDELSAELSGLPVADAMRGGCGYCGTGVGHRGSAWVPYTIMLTDRQHFYVCYPCGHPLTRSK